MIEIEITEELVDWLEERPYCLSREDWEDFAREFVERLYAVGGLRIAEAQSDEV